MFSSANGRPWAVNDKTFENVILIHLTFYHHPHPHVIIKQLDEWTQLAEKTKQWELNLKKLCQDLHRYTVMKIVGLQDVLWRFPTMDDAFVPSIKLDKGEYGVALNRFHLHKAI